MSILQTIIDQKRKGIESRKSRALQRVLSESPFMRRKTNSLREHLTREGASGVIAEFKRLSPSKGPINLDADVEQVTTGYTRAGASALSVLTDFHFFGGAADDLTRARCSNHNIPILRKDFIIDEFQVLEAKSMGADAVLLIAECLETWQVGALASRAKHFGLEVLLELHDESQLHKINDDIDLVGVNNRNLKDFSVSIETALRLAPLLPDRVVKVAESGLSDPAAVKALREAGYQGFLIGEFFMKSDDPAATCKLFIDQLR